MPGLPLKKLPDILESNCYRYNERQDLKVLEVIFHPNFVKSAKISLAKLSPFKVHVLLCYARRSGYMLPDAGNCTSFVCTILAWKQFYLYFNPFLFPRLQTGLKLRYSDNFV